MRGNWAVQSLLSPVAETLRNFFGGGGASAEGTRFVGDLGACPPENF